MRSGKIIPLLIFFFAVSSTSAWLLRRRDRRRCSSTACTWSWRACSRSCGGGIQYSYITRQRGPCGPACNPPSSRSCNNQCCPINCQWGSWGNWGSCSHTCGGGTATRHRSYLTTASCGGSGCGGSSIETKSCNTACCPQDCVWGEWNSWGGCSLTCGRGEQSRQRSIINPSLCGGASCHGDTIHKRVCNDFCCPVNCSISEWSEWDSCSVTCGMGTEIRRRVVEQDEECGGIPCNETMIEHKTCDSGCCPVNCQFEKWGSWSFCSSTCGPNGTALRQRSIKTPATCGGLCSGVLNETRTCNQLCLHGGVINRTACLCPEGWKGDCCEEDDDECEMDSCGANARCRNIPGSYLCECEVGFEVVNPHNGNSSKALHKRKQSGKIRNEIWSENSGDFQSSGSSHEEESSGASINTNISRIYHQKNLSDGFYKEKNKDFQNKNSTKEFRVKESIGLLENNDLNEEAASCVDLDECNLGACGANTNCRNTPGSFVCSCKVGFQFAYSVNEESSGGFLGEGSNATFLSCIDIDECNMSSSQCHMNATCINAIGSFKCQCNPGFSGDGNQCIDINECHMSSSQCHANATCANAIGSFKCQCNPGFTGDGNQCTDVDECLENKTLCEENKKKCENLVGSYKCICQNKDKDGKCVDQNLDQNLVSVLGSRASKKSTPGWAIFLFVMIGIVFVALIVVISVKMFRKHKNSEERHVLLSIEGTSSTNRSQSIEEKSL